MKWSPKKYDAACRAYDAEWAAVDETLYGFCSKHPGHRSPRSVNAKVWIIGRTYATGIERSIPATHKQGGTMKKLADRLLRRRRQVNRIIQRLRRVTEPLAEKKLTVILQAHAEFAGLVQAILRENHSPRSFASKYLHFHCPAVPMYDSVAASNIRRGARWTDSLLTFPLPNNAQGSDEYVRYVARFWKLYQGALKSRPSVTVRLLDYYVISDP